jgi:hypothetical protein
LWAYSCSLTGIISCPLAASSSVDIMEDKIFPGFLFSIQSARMSLAAQASSARRKRVRTAIGLRQNSV